MSMPSRSKAKAKAKSRRSLLINLALVAVGAGLLAYSVSGKWGTIREILRAGVDFKLYALAFGLYLLALTATFFRWFVLVRSVGVAIRPIDAVKLGYIGNVFNLVLPGAVWGDVIKAVFLARGFPAQKTSAAASMVIDRLLGLAGLFLLAGIAGGFAWGNAPEKVRLLIAVVWILLACGLTGLALLFTPRLYPLLDRLVARRARLAKVVHELEAAASAYRSKLGAVVGCLLASTCIHATFVVVFYLASVATLPRIPTFAEHFLIVPLVLFSTAVPLPFGALGFTEGVSQALFSLGESTEGEAAASGSVAMLAFRLVMYASGLIGVVVYLINLNWVRTLTARDATEQTADGPTETPAP